MDKKADYALREHLKEAQRQLKDVIEQYSWLDKADQVLIKLNNLKELQLAIDTYVSKIKMVLDTNLGNKALYEVGAEAYKDIMTALNRYIESGQIKLDIASREAVINSAVAALARTEDLVLGAMSKNLKSKVAHFSLLVKQKLAQVKRMIDESAKVILERTYPEVKIADDKDLKRYWRVLTKKYGDTATVIYSNGRRYPLTTYLDMRARTNSELVHSTVAEAIAVSSEIYFGKISKHNTDDSCIFWEDKIIFYNEALKNAFMRKYPKLRQLVKDYATLDDVRNDRTHMFSFNCRHTIMPYPLHLFDYEDMVNELRQNKMPTIPKNIAKEVKRRVAKAV